MSRPVSPTTTSPPFPTANPANAALNHSIDIDNSPPTSSASSTTSVSSESDAKNLSGRLSSRRTRAERPTMGERQRSSTFIVPRGTDTYQREKPDYPPHDARAMSPRRSSHDLERLEQSARKSLKDQARTLQSSLAALAERIDEVKSDHDKLESENRFLQDYIGGLTRTMSGSGLGRTASIAKKGKK